MKVLIYSIFWLLFILFASYSSFLFFSSPVNSKDTQSKIFIVNNGEGLRSIAIRLEADNLIKNQYVFIVHAYILDLTQKLQAGSFELSPSLDSPAIVRKLSQSGRIDVWVKIIDGQRNSEIKQSLFDQKVFLFAANDKQGYLYPDSYSIPTSSTLDEFFQIINKNYQSKISQIKQNATTSSLDDRQINILASLIEREARTLLSKQYVSGILLNRLKIGMPLQVDATIQYARDSQVPAPKIFWQPVVKKDLSINSPYNTYKNPGLPPNSICNPGYDSLFAAYHPTASNYFYYITGNDNQMHYAATLDEHNTNIAKYLR